MSQAYIGTKIIRATPMTAKQFEHETQREAGTRDKGMNGYKVVYPDGYVSWSPARAFESAYRPISDGEASLIEWPDGKELPV